MIREFTLEDKDYIIKSHYSLYKDEYGYDISFKQFVANKIQEYTVKNDPRERIWLIEIDKKLYGSISISKYDEVTAQLGLFLVDPVLRGTGMGKKLIQTAIDFCVSNKFNKLILWTNADLKSARHIYKKFGFTKVETKESFLSNVKMIEEKWELQLENPVDNEN
ncbi:GNAT family N-acetyltransferase [Bacillus sp. CGMCC 1.16607]|uniref:GNAT family N-acetyltransferase n=1 Tax=Bacillus sp. CGMCC 1.16607 TaxID=3351842 RepID=UPI00363E6098